MKSLAAARCAASLLSRQVGGSPLLASYKHLTTVCVAPMLTQQVARMYTTITTHQGRVIRPERESLTKELIPQHVEKFPFPDARKFSQRISSGEFRGKLHFFVLDFETTGFTRKELPRILEISIDHLPSGKAAETPVPESAPTTTDAQFYSMADPGITSSIHAWRYHKIDRSSVRGKQPMADVFADVVKWSNKFGSAEDLFVFLMPHFAKMEQVTLAHEFIRAKLEAPHNWVFVNATNILQKTLNAPKSQLPQLYSQLFGSEPAVQHRAYADTKTVQACLAKAFNDTDKFRDAVLFEMAQDVTKLI